jgi:hypothetical protein
VASAVVARVTSAAKSFAIVPSAVVALTTSFVIFTVKAASAAALVVASDAIEFVKDLINDEIRVEIESVEII